MASFTNRSENPNPAVAYVEIYFEEKTNLGTGAFRFEVKKNTLSPPIVGSEPKVIWAQTISAPNDFQVTASINVGLRLVAIRLGKADGTLLSRVLFRLPAEFDTTQAHRFEMAFTDWKIDALTLAGKDLEQAIDIQSGTIN